MKLRNCMIAGAIGYTLGCKTGMLRRQAMRSLKQMKRILCKKLGL